MELLHCHFVFFEFQLSLMKEKKEKNNKKMVEILTKESSRTELLYEGNENRVHIGKKCNKIEQSGFYIHIQTKFQSQTEMEWNGTNERNEAKQREGENIVNTFFSTNYFVIRSQCINSFVNLRE